MLQPGLAAATLLAISLLSAGCAPRASAPGTPIAPSVTAAQTSAAAALTQQILRDSATTAAQKRALIEGRPDLGVALLQELSRGMTPGTPEEYVRIPWLWRTALTAASRNDAQEIRQILDFSLPRGNEPLRDWQAVVVGGGLIDGLGRVGQWPSERLAEIMAGDDALRARYQRALDLASAMSDDPRVPNPTRFDALIMVGMQPWDKVGPQLQRYLAAGVEDELQRGAVVGLNALRAPYVPAVLLASLPNLTDRARTLAITGLLRTEDRTAALLDAVQAGRVTAAQIGAERVAALKAHSNAMIAARARQLFPN